MESCGMNFIKYLLFVFNLLFAISGLGIIIAGATVLSDVSDYDHFVSSDLLAPPIVLIVAGAIVFLIAFLGCFGAIRESYKMLLAFAGLLIIIFILEFAVGIAAAVYQADFQNALKTSLKNSIKDYSNPNSSVDKIAWDNIQKRLNCCGVEGPNDWSGQNVPPTCCSTEGASNQNVDRLCIDHNSGSYIMGTGCYDKIQMKISSNIKVLIGVGIGIAFVEVAGIILALWLAYTIKQEQNSK